MAAQTAFYDHICVKPCLSFVFFVEVLENLCGYRLWAITTFLVFLAQQNQQTYCCCLLVVKVSLSATWIMSVCLAPNSRIGSQLTTEGHGKVPSHILVE